MAKASANAETNSAALEQIEIDLKDPFLAAFLAWLIPGAGHWYQGRRHKAVLFFVWILGTFVFGLYLGEGRVVYASLRDNDRRLPYLCQIGVGLPALPALVQAARKTPLQFPIYEDFMAPPEVSQIPNQEDELDRLQKRMHRYWEFGTVYTMIAGLLNILAIYDAWGGPAFALAAPEKHKEDDEGDGQDDDKASKGSGG
ncbi:MAG TPA: DUF6677 family protein [Pirellulales bacterium]|nr:DUF6677 family protein [Pirellulales bacterium]